jgi:quercetin dioxygenase-like cupin family protein
MRRFSILLSVVVLVALSALGLVTARTTAQESTPVAAPAGAVGVTIEARGSGTPDAAPEHQLGLRRVVFAPGGVIHNHHHPGALVLTIESGALGYTVQEGDVTVVRAATNGTPGPAEQLEVGVEVILNPGDALFEQSVVHSARNASDGETVVWVASVIEAGQPFTVFHEAIEATPAA